MLLLYVGCSCPCVHASLRSTPAAAAAAAAAAAVTTTTITITTTTAAKSWSSSSAWCVMQGDKRGGKYFGSDAFVIDYKQYIILHLAGVDALLCW
jgi:hypothetical protein